MATTALGTHHRVSEVAHWLRGRLTVLPRVCKRWARILERPCAAWETAEIDLHELYKHSDLDLDGADWPPLDPRVVSAWFSR